VGLPQVAPLGHAEAATVPCAGDTDLDSAPMYDGFGFRMGTIHLCWHQVYRWADWIPDPGYTYYPWDNVTVFLSANTDTRQNQCWSGSECRTSQALGPAYARATQLNFPAQTGRY